MTEMVVDRLGFTLLSDPGESGGEGCHKVNIILIHGLRGHPQDTWEDDRARTTSVTPWRRRISFFKLGEDVENRPESSTATATPRKVFWPRDYLVRDLPEARIWTYGYNADVLGGMFQANNMNSVSQHAQDLALQLERQIQNQDPIVFVAHSLGGVIVKDALNQSVFCQTRTKFIMFLGTPHRGSSVAGLGVTLANLARLAFQNPNKKLLEEIKLHGDLLQRIHDAFKRTIQQNTDIRIHSFQEGRAMSVGGRKVVDDHSSKLDLLPSIEKVETLDADHRAMARCGSDSDPQYQAICGVLRGFIDKSTTPIDSSHRPEPSVKGKLPEVCAEPSSPETIKPIFLVPYTRNDRFVGRKSILDYLQQQTFTTDCQIRTALFGLGGVGKSQIALEYAYWIRAKEPAIAVYWVHASNAERFRQSFVSIAHQHNIPRCDTTQDVLLLVKEWLVNKAHGHWLMIIDNADNFSLFCEEPGQLKRYLPECSHGRVLVTTRDKQVAVRLTKGRALLEVKEMTVKEASELMHAELTGIEPVPTEEEISNLSSELEQLPLAIAQASAFIRENSVTLQRYLELLHGNDLDFLECLNHDFEPVGRDSEIPHAITKTWILSFEQIRNRSPLAGEILCLMSLMDRQAIPTKLLSIYLEYQKFEVKERHGDEVTRRFKFLAFDQNYKSTKSDRTAILELVKALGILKAFSFVAEDTHHGLNMHRLVQLVTRKWIEARGDLEKMVTQAMVSVAVATPERNWPEYRSYVPHVTALLKLETACRGDNGLLAKAMILREHGFYHFFFSHSNLQAERELSDSAELIRLILGEEDDRTLEALLQKGRLLCFNNRSDEAEILFRKVLETRMKTLGENHEDTLRSMCYLAKVYCARHRWSEALALQTEALRKLTEQHGYKSTRALHIMRRLATMYSNWQEIQALEVPTLSQSQILPKERDTDYGEALSSALDSKSFSSNEEYFKKWEAVADTAFQTSRQVLGDRHMVTLESAYELALLREKQKFLGDAECILRKYYPISIEMHGEGYDLTSRLRYLLVKVIMKQGDITAAARLLEDNLARMRQAHGLGNYSGIDCMVQLAGLYRDLERPDDAENMARWALVAVERVHGAESTTSEVTEALEQLGGMYGKMNRLAEAEKLFLRVLEIRQKTLGDDHNGTLVAMFNLVLTWKKQGQAGKAINLMNDCWQRQKRILGPENIKTLRVAGELVGIYIDSDQLLEAEGLGKYVWETRKQTLGGDHVDTLLSMHNLAVTWARQGRLEKAIDLVEDCWQCRVRVLGPDHEFTIGSRERLENCQEHRRNEPWNRAMWAADLFDEEF